MPRTSAGSTSSRLGRRIAARALPMTMPVMELSVALVIAWACAFAVLG